MTCPICKTKYARTRRTDLSVYVYRRMCDCKRPMKKVEPETYDIRDCWRDEVSR